MKLTFLGTGTSQGIPVIGCTCDVCTSDDPRDNRLRTSAMIEMEGKRFVFDTGPDFRQQMLNNNIADISAIIYTHEHKDHVAGLDDVRPINFLQKRNMPIFCEERVFECLKREYQYVFDDSFKYPGIPQIEPNIISNEPFEVNGVEVTPIRVWHYKLPVFGFRIGDTAYITDANRIDPEEKEKLEGLDCIVLNALRKEPHISHFTLQDALNLIQELKPRVAYLTHASHLLGKHAIVQAELPVGVHLAYDGLSVPVR